MGRLTTDCGGGGPSSPASFPGPSPPAVASDEEEAAVVMTVRGVDGVLLPTLLPAGAPVEGAVEATMSDMGRGRRRVVMVRRPSARVGVRVYGW